VPQQTCLADDSVAENVATLQGFMANYLPQG
jgi:hypothetical protein